MQCFVRPRLRKLGRPVELRIAIERLTGLIVDTLVEEGFTVIPGDNDALLRGMQGFENWLTKRLNAYSSGGHFDGWRDPPDLPPHERGQLSIQPARSWLLRIGWRRHGLIATTEVPGG